MGGSDSHVVTYLVECCTESTGRLKASEAKHRVIALLDRSMTLLQTVVQILILAVQDFTTDDPAYRLLVSRMLVCSQA